MHTMGLQSKRCERNSCCPESVQNEVGLRKVAVDSDTQLFGEKKEDSLRKVNVSHQSIETLKLKQCSSSGNNIKRNLRTFQKLSTSQKTHDWSKGPLFICTTLKKKSFWRKATRIPQVEKVEIRKTISIRKLVRYQPSVTNLRAEMARFKAGSIFNFLGKWGITATDHNIF